jgi:hypothetical protein
VAGWEKIQHLLQSDAGFALKARRHVSPQFIKPDLREIAEATKYVAADLVFIILNYPETDSGACHNGRLIAENTFGKSSTWKNPSSAGGLSRRSSAAFRIA